MIVKESSYVAKETSTVYKRKRTVAKLDWHLGIIAFDD